MIYNSVNFSALGLRVTKIDGRSDLPESQAEDEQVLGSEQVVTIGDEIARLKTITCTIDTTGGMVWDTLKSNERQIRAALFGKGFKRLDFDDAGGKYFLARAKALTLPEEGGKFWSDGTLEYLAFPFMLAASETTFNIAAGASSANTTNDGDALAYPVYTVTFTAGVSSFQITVGTKTLTIAETLTTSDTVTIDTAKQTVLKGTTNIIHKASGDFPTIPTGAQTVSKTVSSVAVVAAYRKRYI